MITFGVQKQVIPTSGVVGALGPPVYQSGTREQSPEQDESAGRPLSGESDPVKDPSPSDQSPPPLFQLASGFFQGMRQTDAEVSSSTDAIDQTGCVSAGEELAAWILNVVAWALVLCHDFAALLLQFHGNEATVIIYICPHRATNHFVTQYRINRVRDVPSWFLLHWRFWLFIAIICCTRRHTTARNHLWSARRRGLEYQCVRCVVFEGHRCKLWWPAMAWPGSTNGAVKQEQGEKGRQTEGQLTLQDEMEKLRTHLSEAISRHPGQQQPLKWISFKRSSPLVLNED